MTQKLYELLKRQGARAEVTPPPTGSDNEFCIYDVIGRDLGASAKNLQVFLAEHSEEPEIHIRINSPGGSAYEGRAMSTLIRNFKGKTICHVDGIAASAASIVAVSCDEVIMGKGTMLMIHNAWSLAVGNRHDMQKEAQMLAKLDEAMATDYAAKSGKTVEEIHQMMDAETWLTDQEALDLGFATRIDESAMAMDTSGFNLDAYEHPPENLLIKETPKAEELEDFSEMIKAQERRLKLFKFA